LQLINRAAMSWAALNKRLRGLLPRFRLPVDDPAALDLDAMLHDFSGAGGALSRLQGSGVGPSAAEGKALRK